MDQTQRKQDEDLPWSELNKNGVIIEKDILEKLERVGPKAYPHQFEFLQYTLGQPVSQQAPIIALRSLTGSGKTLCFQTIIFQNYKPEIHAQVDAYRTGKDGGQKRILQPYAVVLGNTIFLKQHEEAFTDQLPPRLLDKGMKFQTFFAFSKDSQFHTTENKIEDATSNVYFCHPSKLNVGIKKNFLSFKNLRYLIIDEADQLLVNDPQNRARSEVQNILQYLFGQHSKDALNFQIIFVSASLKTKEIEDIVTDAIQNNFEQDKKIDPRFVTQVGITQKPRVEIKVLPSNQSNDIASYSIRHYFIDNNDTAEDSQAKTLAEILSKVFLQFDTTQVMVFFNTKLATKTIFEELLKSPLLKFMVEKNLIALCTGGDNQEVREQIRKEFKDQTKTLLLCTDVLQRGLDFRQVRLIIHYGVAASGADNKFAPEVYYQRSGRTGRAKDEGVVLTILSQSDKKSSRNGVPPLKEAMATTLQNDGTKLVEYNDEIFLQDLKAVLEFNNEKSK